MPIDWKTPEAYTRLLAAMVASQDLKFDYRRIASMYGQGATYDSIEGRFRIIKREAAVLKDEIETGTRPEAPARGATTTSTAPNEQTPKKETTLRKPRTPKKTPIKSEAKVANGRIMKTPSKSKKAGANVVKGIKEEIGSSDSSFFMGDVSAEVTDEHSTEDQMGWGAGMLDFDGIVDHSMEI